LPPALAGGVKFESFKGFSHNQLIYLAKANTNPSPITPAKAGAN